MHTVAQERLVEVPGGRVWTSRHEGGAGTPLLVVHGGPGMPSDYLQVLSALSADRPVVFYDQLGCGRSDRPEDPGLWTLDRSLTELAAVRQALGLDRVHLLGHSWGGFLALAHASQVPGTVASLVLSSPLVSVAAWLEDAAELLAGLPVDAQATIAEHEQRADFDSPAYQAATDLYNRRHFCTLDPWPAELRRTMAELGEGPYRTMWGPSEFTQTGNLRGHDLTSALPGLGRAGVRSLWVAGDRDEVKPDRLTGFADLAGGAAVVLEGGSHCVHLERTDAYLAAVGDFLRAQDGSATPREAS